MDFSQGTVGVFQIYFALIWYKYKMTQYNALYVNLPNSQINILKSGIKSYTKVTLNLLSNVICNFNDKANFPHKLFSTD